ncbi:unnamed protein product [Leptosia nina]|uniref:Uncharacterized protein n=1 Tax=Leptosia nina TaxID=320188 RepID=A0AAV1IVT7_9NEOP
MNIFENTKGYTINIRLLPSFSGYLLSYAIHLSPGKRHRGWRPDSAPVDVTRHRTLVAIAVCQTVDTINPNEGTEAIIGAIQLFNGPGL